MAIVFDEVVTQVEAPPPAREPQAEQAGGQPLAEDKLRCWQKQQAIFWRRQQRLEAD